MRQLSVSDPVFHDELIDTAPDAAALGCTALSGIDRDAGQVAFARALKLEVVQVDDPVPYLTARPAAYATILLMDVLEHLPREAHPGLLRAIAGSEAAADKHLWTEKEYGDFTLRVDWRIKETPYTNPNVHIVTTIFESESAYRTFSDSPEQDKRFREMSEMLAGEPEWNDGEVIHHDAKVSATR